MAHTPGPWTWTGIFIEDATGETIAATHVNNAKEYEANGALIAAAPAMRTALLGLLADMIGNDEALNDPLNDASGRESRPPDGDDYNVLFDNVLDAVKTAGIDVDKEIERIKTAIRSRK